MAAQSYFKGTETAQNNDHYPFFKNFGVKYARRNRSP